MLDGPADLNGKTIKLTVSFDSGYIAADLYGNRAVYFSAMKHFDDWAGNWSTCWQYPDAPAGQDITFSCNLLTLASTQAGDMIELMFGFQNSTGTVTLKSVEITPAP